MLHITNSRVITLQKITHSYDEFKFKKLMVDLLDKEFAKEYLQKIVTLCKESEKIIPIDDSIMLVESQQTTPQIPKRILDISDWCDDIPMRFCLECVSEDCYNNRLLNPHIRNDFERKVVEKFRIPKSDKLVVTLYYDEISLTTLIILANLHNTNTHLVLNVISPKYRAYSQTGNMIINLHSENRKDDKKYACRINNGNFQTLNFIKILEILTAVGYINPEIRLFNNSAEVEINSTDLLLGIDYFDDGLYQIDNFNWSVCNLVKENGMVASLRTDGIFSKCAVINICSCNISNDNNMAKNKIAVEMDECERILQQQTYTRHNDDIFDSPEEILINNVKYRKEIPNSMSTVLKYISPNYPIETKVKLDELNAEYKKLCEEIFRLMPNLYYNVHGTILTKILSHVSYSIFGAS